MLVTLIASIPYPPPGTETSPYAVQVFIAMRSWFEWVFYRMYCSNYFFLQEGHECRFPRAWRDVRKERGVNRFRKDQG